MNVCFSASLDVNLPGSVDVISGIKKNVRKRKVFLLEYIFFSLGLTPCKAEQPLRGMQLQEKKHKKDYRVQKICLERTYS